MRYLLGGLLATAALAGGVVGLAPAASAAEMSSSQAVKPVAFSTGGGEWNYNDGQSYNRGSHYAQFNWYNHGKQRHGQDWKNRSNCSH